MGMINVPDTLFTRLDDLERRIRIQETTAKVGLDQLRYCTATGSATPAVYGTNEYGTVGNTWRDDTGATGTGYPTITMTTPTKCLFMFGFRPYNVASSATFRTNDVQVNLRIDADPGWLNRQFTQANIDQTLAPVISAGVMPVTAGSHTFTIGATWQDVNPAAPNLPLLSDAYLIILPLNV